MVSYLQWIIYYVLTLNLLDTYKHFFGLHLLVMVKLTVLSTGA